MDFEALLLGYLSKTLNIDINGVAELIKSEEGVKPEALEVILNLHKEKVKEHKTANIDEGYKKAERKINSEYEKLVKEKYGIETDKKGVELIDAIIADKSKPEALTEEAVKKHPVFINLEKKIDSIKSETVAEYEKRVQEIQKNYENEKKFELVKKKAIADFESLNPVLPQDTKKGENLKKVFLNELGIYDFQLLNENEILVLNKETGQRVEDEYGHPIKFHELVKKTASEYFDFKQASPRSSTGLDPNKPLDSKPLPKIGSEEEYMKALSDKSLSLEQREEIMQAYKNK